MTTTTVPADSWLLGGRGGKQRLIPDPSTGELVPYQRVSTFAKTLDDKEGLLAWKAWMTLKGSQLDNALTQQALHAEATPRGVIDQLAELGGSRVKAQKGSDRHEILAMALRGHTLPEMPADARAEVDALVELVRGLGTVTAVETPTVCDRYKVCGTVDLVLESPEGPIVADFKTGARADTLAWSIQLIAHARGHWWDQANQKRLGLVVSGRPRLIVIHAPQDGSPPKAIDLDVDMATYYADIAMAVREARKTSAVLDRKAGKK